MGKRKPQTDSKAWMVRGTCARCEKRNATVVIAPYWFVCGQCQAEIARMGARLEEVRAMGLDLLK